MAFLAKVFYSGDGATDDFTITFDFQENVDVVVTVGGVLQVEDTNYSISGTTLTFSAGSIPASGTDNIEIKRVTTTVPRVDFANSGIITEAKLDRQNLQNSYIVEEVKDDSQSTLRLDTSNNYDAESTKIVNVDDPTAAQDAATKSYVDAVATGTLPGPRPVAQGGTGSATAAGARTNLSVPSTAEVTALVDDLSGVSDAATARTNLSVPSVAEQTAAILAAVGDLSGVTDPSGARVNIGAQQNVTTARGDIVRGGAGGLVERLALGTTGQVLKSDGTDVVWDDNAGGGVWEEIASGNLAAGAGPWDFAFTAASWRAIRLVVTSVDMTTSGGLLLNVTRNNFAGIVDGANTYRGHRIVGQSDGATVTGLGIDGTNISLHAGNLLTDANAVSSAFDIVLFSPNTLGWAALRWSFAAYIGTNIVGQGSGGALARDDGEAAAIDGIRLSLSAGALAGGDYKLLGLTG